MSKTTYQPGQRVVRKPIRGYKFNPGADRGMVIASDVGIVNSGAKKPGYRVLLDITRDDPDFDPRFDAKGSFFIDSELTPESGVASTVKARRKPLKGLIGARKPPSTTVCGIPIRHGGTQRVRIGVPVARPDYGYTSISRVEATKLVTALGVGKVPRPGMRVKLCGEQYLTNVHGSLEVERFEPGDIRGARRRVTKRS